MIRIRTEIRLHFVRSVAFVAAAAVVRSAHAGDSTLAEPIIEENITDVDAYRAGTLEMDLTATSLASRSAARAGAWSSEIEAEWRAVDRFGLGFGLATAGPTSGLSPVSATAVIPRAAASFVFLRDRPRRLFLQGEATARYSTGDASDSDPLDPALPYGVAVRWATEVGRFTLRSAFHVEAGGDFVRAPLRQSYSVLFECFEGPVRLYVGAEGIEDWARASPIVVVPEVMLITRVLGQPLRIGVGVPDTVEARGSGQIGVAFRFVVEPDE